MRFFKHQAHLTRFLISVAIIFKFLQRTRCIVARYNCSFAKCVAITRGQNKRTWARNILGSSREGPRRGDVRDSARQEIERKKRVRRKGGLSYYEVDTHPPMLKDKNCVAAKRYMRELARVRTPLCYFRAANRAASPEALNRTGLPDEEGSSRDTVPTCWSIAPSLTWVNNKRGNVKFTTRRTRDHRSGRRCRDQYWSSEISSEW